MSSKNGYGDVAFVISATSVFYYGTQDEILKAAALPVGGFCIQKLGEYCASRGMEHIGQAMFFGGVFSVPALAVGKTIYTLGGENVTSILLAIGGGVLATQQTFNFITKWAADRIAHGIP